MAASKEAQDFYSDSDVKSFDLKHRSTIKYNMGKYNASVELGKKQFYNHNLARDRAAFVKQQTLDNLHRYLLEWEENFTKNGGKVIWASNADDAVNAITDIVTKANCKTIVKSKSMTTEEIELNEHLEHKGVKVVETDLGEFIVQIAGQKPYHIVTPAMHLSREDIGKIFVDKLNIEYTSDPTELTLTARRLLRDEYTRAEVGISGGNFLIADIGGIALTENEGNARLSTTFPKIHIAVVGIEKMIPKFEDLALFWPLLGTSGTGQDITVYSTVITGPKKQTEADGPHEMYVVLLDNGRSHLLADTDKREALRCIRCGACLNACPVYRNVGGHTYATPYSGPIGSVIMPHYGGMEKFKHLSHASSLCGACTSVCPVKINIHKLLLKNRVQSVEMGLSPMVEQVGFKGWTMAMQHKWMAAIVPTWAKNIAISQISKVAWSKHREPLQAPGPTFTELYNKYKKAK